MDSYSVSEQTRRILSPYNRHCYRLFNLNLRNHFKTIKITLDEIMNNLNTNLYSLKNLKEIKIYQKKIFKINQILTRLHKKRFIFNNKNNSLFLYLRNFIYILIKYITQIEICIHGIEWLKKHFNHIISFNGFIKQQQEEIIRTQLIYIVNKIRNEIKNKSYHKQADFLMITFDILCSVRSTQD
ncbi:unnamed protein product [Rotaria sp. Silwood2]|nr:unnamed protein product [Rotaria sp. Silwood2]CAF2855677.1 unnamed protein product [Rotaria sp. Silwood2]CAF4157612.1 unnamed protein product [Rotaria sp. Silwood2]CAF4475061.1 unnamed protein product [Rotaria sp. Silwood2]